MSKNDHVIVIAEVGVNHNGSLETALKLVDAAADAGADVVKFQTFQAKHLVTKDAPKADYQIRQTGDEAGQFEMLKSLELSHADHMALTVHCSQKGIEFLSTPFDLDSLDFLADKMGLDCIKVGSGDMTNAPLLYGIARKKCRIILSTGMASLDEVERALGVLAFGYVFDGTPNNQAFQDAYNSDIGQSTLKENVTLLHCTTEYPAPHKSINLKAMDALVERFGLPVGFSDHSAGATASIAATALGVCIIEKHITLDRGMDGPDHLASMEPDEFAAMVQAVRDVEHALGSKDKQLSAEELANKSIARKSLVAAQTISKGAFFTEENLTVKRPETGASPFDYYDMIGKQADRDFDIDEVIK